ncbi:hypothetical protein PO256_23560, partial [Bacteroides ovatus]
KVNAFLANIQEGRSLFCGDYELFRLISDMYWFRIELVWPKSITFILFFNQILISFSQHC